MFAFVLAEDTNDHQDHTNNALHKDELFLGKLSLNTFETVALGRTEKVCSKLLVLAGVCEKERCQKAV